MLDKTERIDETLNPKWHDHCYRGDIPKAYYENRDALVLRIYDWDYFGGDDVMGQVVIPLQDITSYGTEAWYPVYPSVCLSVCLSVVSLALLSLPHAHCGSMLMECILCRFRPIRKNHTRGAEGRDGRGISRCGRSSPAWGSCRPLQPQRFSQLAESHSTQMSSGRSPPSSASQAN